jgi:hypothetical protein
MCSRALPVHRPVLDDPDKLAQPDSALLVAHTLCIHGSVEHRDPVGKRAIRRKRVLDEREVLVQDRGRVRRREREGIRVWYAEDAGVRGKVGEDRLRGDGPLLRS